MSRKFFHNESFDESSTTSSTASVKCQLSIPDDGTYVLIGSAVVKQSNTSGRVFVQMNDSDSTNHGSCILAFDDANEIQSVMFTGIITVSGSTKTVNIKFARYTAGTAYIKNVAICAIKTETGDQYDVESQNLSDTNTTYESVGTDISVGAGDYLIIGHMKGWHDTAGVALYGQLKIGGTGYLEQKWLNIQDSGYTSCPFFFVYRYTATGTTAISIEKKDGSGSGNNYFGTAALIALKLDTFVAEVTMQKTDATNTTTTNTSYQEMADSLDASGEMTGFHWLKIHFCRIYGDTTTTGYWTKTRAEDFTASSDYKEESQRRFSDTSERYGTGFAVISDYTPNGTTVMGTLATTNASHTAGVYSNRIIFLQLEVANYTIQKSIAYKVKTTPSAITKTLAYKIKYSPSTIQKALAYVVVQGWHTIQKGLVYRVKSTPSTITKTLAYVVPVTYSIQKSLAYAVYVPVTHTIQKSLSYRPLIRPTIQKPMEYIIPNILSCCEMPVRRIHGKVTITYSSPAETAGITITSSGEVYRTDDEDAADVAYGAAYKWFSLQENVLDGSFHPMPTDTVGWWSSTKADTSGNFSPAVWLQYVFGEVQVVDHLEVKGDDKLGGYPVDFTIKLYNSSDVLQHTETVSSNSSVNWEIDIDMHTGIKKVKLEVTKISKPSVSCRVTEFKCAGTFSETYEDDDLFYINVLEETDYDGATIPIGNISSNEITVRIDNSSGRFDLDNPTSPVAAAMIKNRKIEAWLGIEVPYGGSTTWHSLGVFYSHDWRVYPDRPYVEVVGLDRLSLLSSTEFYTTQIYTSQTLYDLAVIVLASAGVSSSDYDIDDSLDDITIPYTWFNRTSHRYALKEIAEACLGVLYCDRSGKIILAPYSDAETAKVSITSDKYFSKNHPIKWNEIVNYVEVQAKPRVLGSLTEIYNDVESLTVPASGTATRFCQFNTSDPCTDVATPEFTQSGSNITITAHTDYTWATAITFSNSGGSAENVTSITIDGKILSTAGNKIAVAEDDASIKANGRQSLGEPIQNNYIQTKARAQDIADEILLSYKDPRKDVELDCRGYTSLYLRDRISVPTYDDDHLLDYTVIRQDIRWDGSLRVMITGRKII